LVASAGPIDEIVQFQATATPVLVQASPLAIAMIGAAPRPSLPLWLAGHPYSLGDKVVSGTTTPDTSYSVIYQCVIAGTSGGGPSSPFPTTTTPPSVGTTIAEGPSTPQLTWQVMLDPLSVDPDDPFGIATTFISETPSSSSALPPLTPNTWSVPLIISCGADGLLGLYEPNDSANFGTLAQPQLSPLIPGSGPPPTPADPSGFNRDPMLDNITNHQQ
jgi:hypothetical protein